MKKLVFVIVSSMMLSACGSWLEKIQHDNDNLMELEVCTRTDNYQCLLNHYREILSNKEDAKARLKVAEYYYLLNDYESSLHFLQPLLEDKSKSIEAYTLKAKNLMDIGRREDAYESVNEALALDSKNGELYNIKGILLAELGEYNQAEEAFMKARERFIDDVLVLNNLAMVAILKDDYQKAIDYLTPIYQRGEKSNQLVHNLVFALIKTNQHTKAEAILKAEEIDTPIEELIIALRNVQPIKFNPQQEEIVEDGNPYLSLFSTE